MQTNLIKQEAGRLELSQNKQGGEQDQPVVRLAEAAIN